MPLRRVHDLQHGPDGIGAFDPEAVTTAANLLRALGNPHRLALVLQLHHNEQCVHELVAALDIPQPLVSQHLRVLRAERLVRGAGEGARWRTRCSTTTSPSMR